jgi:hypothetical protein
LTTLAEDSKNHDRLYVTEEDIKQIPQFAVDTIIAIRVRSITNRQYATHALEVIAFGYLYGMQIVLWNNYFCLLIKIVGFWHTDMFWNTYPESCKPTEWHRLSKRSALDHTLKVKYNLKSLKFDRVGGIIPYLTLQNPVEPPQTHTPGAIDPEPQTHTPGATEPLTRSHRSGAKDPHTLRRRPTDPGPHTNTPGTTHPSTRKHRPTHPEPQTHTPRAFIEILHYLAGGCTIAGTRNRDIASW